MDSRYGPMLGQIAPKIDQRKPRTRDIFSTPIEEKLVHSQLVGIQSKQTGKREDDKVEREMESSSNWTNKGV